MTPDRQSPRDESVSGEISPPCDSFTYRGRCKNRAKWSVLRGNPAGEVTTEIVVCGTHKRWLMDDSWTLAIEPLEEGS